MTRQRTLLASFAFGAAMLSPILGLASTVFDRDMAFGTQGTTDVWFDAGQQFKDSALSLLRRDDGDIDVIARVQIATTDRYGVGLQRVTPGGARVGTKQVISVLPLTSVNDATRTQDGKILVLGTRVYDAHPTIQVVVLLRINADYSLDTTFDGVGWRAYDIVDDGVQRNAFPEKLVSLPSGDIVVIGYGSTNNNTLYWSLKMVLAHNGALWRSCSADTSVRYTSIASAASTLAGSADDVLIAEREISTGKLNLSLESMDSGSCFATNGIITVNVPSWCPDPLTSSVTNIDGVLLRTNDASSATASFLFATGTRQSVSTARAALFDVDVTASAGPWLQGASCGLGDVVTKSLAQSDDRQQVFLNGWRCRSCINGEIDDASAVVKRIGSNFLPYPVPLPFQGVPGYKKRTFISHADTYKTPLIATPGLADSFVLAGTRTLSNGTDEDVVLTRHGLVPALFENGFD